MTNTATQYAAIHAQLDQFATLEPGWDSYGAAPIPPAPIAAAHALLDELAERVRPAAGWRLDAVPHPEGGVVLEWDGPRLAIEVNIVRSRCEWHYCIEDRRTPARTFHEEHDVPRATVFARLAVVLGEGRDTNRDTTGTQTRGAEPTRHEAGGAKTHGN
jgi:hypothetical protein